MARSLNEIELLVLLAVIRLEPNAYGVSITREIETKGRRSASVASVYGTLERLAQSGFVTSCLGEATPQRGGRPKRLFQATSEGIAEARRAREALASMWDGLFAVHGGAA